MAVQLTQRQKTIVEALDHFLDSNVKHLFIVHVAHTKRMYGYRTALFSFIAKCCESEVIYIARFKTEVKIAYQIVASMLKLLYPQKPISLNKENGQYQIRMMHRTYQFSQWDGEGAIPIVEDREILHIFDVEHDHLDRSFDKGEKVIWWTRNEVILSDRWQKAKEEIDKSIVAIVYETSLSYDGHHSDIIFV